MMPAGQRARRATRSGGEAPVNDDLPDDVLFAIFSRVPDAADAARCAATCRRWGRVVAARAAAIARALPPPGRFVPHLALGFLHRQDKRARGRAQLRFVPTAASRRHQYRQLLPSMDEEASAAAAAARPVASRNGRVVLELRRSATGGLVTLSVWNPMTGDASVFPPPVSVPGDYACAVLTGDDLDDDGSSAASPGFFRLLLVYNRRTFTALRSYDSSSGSWGPEATKPGAKISDRALRQLGPAVVLRGVAYWPLRDAALGVRLDDDSMDVCSLPYMLTHNDADHRLLGMSPDGKSLRFLGVCFTRQTTLTIAFLTTQLQGNSRGYIWDPVLDQRVMAPGVGRVTRTTTFKLRWFGEKSGTLLFTVGDAAGGSGTSSSAVFALNLGTGALEKLAEGDGYHACRDMCGYEMDRAALLASVPPR